MSSHTPPPGSGDERLPSPRDPALAGRSPTSSRGPLLLFAVGALLAAVVGAVQFLHLPLPGLGMLPGSRHAASAAAGSAAPRSASGVPVVRDLNQLREKYGEPKLANYGRIRIPSINVDAPLSRSVVGKDGQLADPIGPSDVAWYDFAGRNHLGGVPGAGGNAVFAGHVDRVGHLEYAGVDYNGPAIFFWLDRLSTGDMIEVTANGKTFRYAVVWSKEVSAAAADWNQLFSSKVLGDTITLVTCGGEFDYDTHEYKHRLVVRAVRG